MTDQTITCERCGGDLSTALTTVTEPHGEVRTRSTCGCCGRLVRGTDGENICPECARAAQAVAVRGGPARPSV